MVLLSELLEADSSASKEAQRLKLTHVGWGRYADQSGMITHVSKDGKLVPIQKTGLRPRRVRGPITPVPEEPTQVSGKDIIPISKVPTKDNPSFEELSNAAKNHKRVIMSRKPISRINFSKPYVRKKYQRHHDRNFKPIGIWYSVGSDWIDWVAGNIDEWKGKYLYALEVDDSQTAQVTDPPDPSKMLIIDSPRAMWDFNKRYSQASKYLKHYKTGEALREINWQQVQKDYGGIQIASPSGEYFWDFRMRDEFNWYYSWDVASGCIWNPELIQSAKQIPVE